METGSWKLAPFIPYPKAGWRPGGGAEGWGGNGWVENKGFLSLFKSRTRPGVGVHFFCPSAGFSPNLGLGPPLSSPKWLTGSKVRLRLGGRQEGCSLQPPLLPLSQADFHPPRHPPKAPCYHSRWPPRGPADRTSIRDGTCRRPLFLEVSRSLTFLLPPWRPARDGGKPGHRPGPERR